MNPNETKLNIISKISRNSLSNTAGLVVNILIGLVSVPIIVSYLGLSQFGLFVLLSSIMSYLGLFDLGFNQTFIKISADLITRKDDCELNIISSTIFFSYLVIGIIAGLITYFIGFFSPILFKVSPDDFHQINIVFLLLSVQIALGFPFSILKGLTGGLQDFHYINFVSITTNILKLGLTVLFLSLGYNFVSLFIIAFVVQIIEWVAYYIWVQKVNPNWKINLKQFQVTRLKPLMKFSGVMFIWNIAARTLSQSGKIMIGVVLPVANVSFYEIGMQLNEYSRRFMTILLDSLLPAISSLNAINRNREIKQLYLKGTKYILFFYSLLVGVLFVFSNEFINLWIGKGYNLSSTILRILLIGSLFQCQNVVGHFILVGIGELKIFARIMTILPFMFIILSLLLMFKFQLIGVALSYSITIIILEIYFIQYVLKYFSVSFKEFFKKCHIPIITFILPSVLISYLSKYLLNTYLLSNLVLVIFSVTVIVITTYYIWGIDNSEKVYIKEAIIKLTKRKNNC